MRETIMYASKHPKEIRLYRSFMAEKRHADIWGEDEKDVVKVRVREALTRDEKEEAYFAWWENKDEKFIFIYPIRQAVDMCFTYGAQVEIERQRRASSCGDRRDQRGVVQ